MATLLTSAEAEMIGLGPAVPVKPAAPPAVAHAPSIGVPLSFIVFGLACLLGAVALLVVRPGLLSTYHYNQCIVAATHLALLGWIGSIVFGALYQLVPVVLETKLFSERLAFVHLVCHVTGSLGMVWSFWHWNLKHVGHWGSVFALGVGLLFFNIAWTALRSRKRNPVTVGIGSAISWLMLAVLAGLALAASKCTYESIERLSSGSPLAVTLRGLERVSAFLARFDQMSAMHSHAHLGALGCFVLLIVAVSLKLLPMFLLSDVQSPQRAWWTVGLMNVGLLGLVPTMATRSHWKMLFCAIILAALLSYLMEVRAIVRARKRRVFDLPLKLFLSTLLVLAPLGVLAGVLSWPGLPLTVFTGQLENLYGFLAVFGLISSAIIAMLFKILPFLVWYGTYSPHLGRARVPNLADMYSEKLLRAGSATYILALAVLVCGILVSSPFAVRCGGAALTAAVLLHCINYTCIISHRLRPRLQPVAAKPAA